MDGLVNVAPPFPAATEVVPASAPPPGLTEIATVTVPVNVVSTFPKASVAFTTGCVGKTAPAGELPGEVVKARRSAVRLNALLGAGLVSAPVAAANRKLPPTPPR